MWLLQFHFAFSVLCLICQSGIKIVFSAGLKRYRKKGNKISAEYYFLYFCPIINVLLLIALLYMAICDDTTAKSLNVESEEE